MKTMCTSGRTQIICDMFPGANVQVGQFGFKKKILVYLFQCSPTSAAPTHWQHLSLLPQLAFLHNQFIWSRNSNCSVFETPNHNIKTESSALVWGTKFWKHDPCREWGTWPPVENGGHGHPPPPGNQGTYTRQPAVSNHQIATPLRHAQGPARFTHSTITTTTTQADNYSKLPRGNTGRFSQTTAMYNCRHSDNEEVFGSRAVKTSFSAVGGSFSSIQWFYSSRNSQMAALIQLCAFGHFFPILRCRRRNTHVNDCEWNHRHDWHLKRCMLSKFFDISLLCAGWITTMQHILFQRHNLAGSQFLYLSGNDWIEVRVFPSLLPLTEIWVTEITVNSVFYLGARKSCEHGT